MCSILYEYEDLKAAFEGSNTTSEARERRAAEEELLSVPLISSFPARLETTVESLHAGNIIACRFNCDGSLIATGGADRVIKIICGESNRSFPLSFLCPFRSQLLILVACHPESCAPLPRMAHPYSLLPGALRTGSPHAAAHTHMGSTKINSALKGRDSALRRDAGGLSWTSGRGGAPKSTVRLREAFRRCLAGGGQAYAQTHLARRPLLPSERARVHTSRVVSLCLYHARARAQTHRHARRHALHAAACCCRRPWTARPC